MEMVSASKMRRAQEQVKASRPFASRLLTILHTIGSKTDPSLHPLLQEKSSGQPLLILLSTDRGLCGGLNTNLFKAVLDYKTTQPNLVVCTVGRKAQEFASRLGLEIVASFIGLPEKITIQDVLPIAELARDGFLDGRFSQVSAIHMEFINTLTQTAKITEVLPLKPLVTQAAEMETVTADKEYTFEPNAAEILNWLLPYFIESEMFQLMLDAKASEHSARMIAMQSASDNAKDVVGSLKLEYNKGRQATITRELIETTTASLSIAG